jgi:hypothetical protein
MLQIKLPIEFMDIELNELVSKNFMINNIFMIFINNYELTGNVFEQVKLKIFSSLKLKIII